MKLEKADRWSSFVNKLRTRLSEIEIGCRCILHADSHSKRESSGSHYLR